MRHEFFQWDVFVSHASEDTSSIAKPLTDLLKARGLKVWYDGAEIQLGDNINEKILEGLKKSKIGILIITEAFLKKNWTNMELGVLNYKSRVYERTLIPVFYKIKIKDVTEKLPFLGNIKGFLANDSNIIELAEEICENVTLVNSQQNKNYKNLNELSIKEISETFKKINNQKLNRIAEILEKILRIAGIDTDMALIKTKILLNIIVNDVCQITNNNYDTEFINLKKIKIINQNIIEHFSILQRFGEVVWKDKEFGLSSTKSNWELCQLSLTAILNWYFNNFYINIPIENRILSVIEVGMLTNDDMLESYNIEHKVLRSDMISPVEVVQRWYNYNNYTMIGIRDNSNGKLAGFINALPVTNNFFKKIMSGNYVETDIPLREIQQYDYPDFYKLYLSSFCISPYYMNTNAFKLLYDAFINLLLHLAISNEIYITELIADASTIQGERLCNIVGMRFVTNTNHNSKIYKAVLIPPSIQLRNQKGKELLLFYQRKFEEFKEFFTN